MVIYWEQLPRYPPKNFHHFPPQKTMQSCQCTCATQLGRRCSRKTWVTIHMVSRRSMPFPKMLPWDGNLYQPPCSPCSGGGHELHRSWLWKWPSLYIHAKTLHETPERLLHTFKQKKAEARMTGHLRIHGFSLQGKIGLTRNKGFPNRHLLNLASFVAHEIQQATRQSRFGHHHCCP